MQSLQGSELTFVERKKCLVYDGDKNSPGDWDIGKGGWPGRFLSGKRYEIEKGRMTGPGVA